MSLNIDGGVLSAPTDSDHRDPEIVMGDEGPMTHGRERER